MSIADELKEIESGLNMSPVAYQALLKSVGIESVVTEAGLSIECPNCSTKRRSINIRLKDNKYGRLKWRCYRCEDSPHLKNYDNLIGLVRLFHSELTPYEILNLLFASHS